MWGAIVDYPEGVCQEKNTIQDKFFWAPFMIQIALREAMSSYWAKYGTKHTYPSLAKTSRFLFKVASDLPGYEKIYAEISRGTLETIARDPFYNTSVRRLNTLCRLLDTTAHDLVKEIPDDEMARMAKADPHRDDEAEGDAPTTAGRQTDVDADVFESFDPVSSAALHVIKDLGYTVEVSREDEAYKFTATHPADGTQTSQGTDLLRTICDLAEKVGIDLEDG